MGFFEYVGVAGFCVYWNADDADFYDSRGNQICEELLTKTAYCLWPADFADFRRALLKQHPIKN